MWKCFLKHIKANFLPYDILNLVFVFFLLVISFLSAFFWPSAAYLIIVYLFCLVMIILCSLSSKDLNHKKIIIHYFYPVFLIFFIFESLGYLIACLHLSYQDGLLYQLDVLLCGGCPFIYLQKWINPWLTELLQLAYISYYFMPLILGLALFYKKDHRLCSVIFSLLLGFYLCYLGYLVFPAVGPRFYLHFDKSVYENTYLAKWVAECLNILEKNKTDAFPSGHTQISVMSAYFSHYLGRGWVISFSLVTIFLILSTVYCRYHYIVDIIVGILLAVISLKIAPLLEKMILQWLDL
jgi:membrane-associated phospholipid phosphatase